MVKKSIITSFRLNEEDYLKIKALKEKYNLSWTKLMAYTSELIEQDMKNKTEDKNDNTTE